jgi:hypothetical protein
MLQADLRSGFMARKMRAITSHVKPMTGFWLSGCYDNFSQMSVAAQNRFPALAETPIR